MNELHAQDLVELMKSIDESLKSIAFVFKLINFFTISFVILVGLAVLGFMLDTGGTI